MYSYTIKQEKIVAVPIFQGISMNYETRPLQSWELCKKLVSDFYGKAFGSKEEGRLLAWAGQTTPFELLWAMDVVPIFGEPYGATCQGGDLALEIFKASEKEGYVRDLCAYARSYIGSVIKGNGPWGRIPIPDFLFSARNPCNVHLKWWEAMGRHLGLPLFLMDTPSVEGRMEKRHIDYYVAQLKRFIEFMERICRKKLQEDRLIEAVYLGKRCARLWDDCLDFIKVKPCPVGLRTLHTLMMPVIVLRGTKEAVEFYSMLYKELEEWASVPVAAIPNERYRLMWDNIPPWHDLALLRHPERLGAIFVISTYSVYWGLRVRQSEITHGFGIRPATDMEPSSSEEALEDLAKFQIQQTALFGSIAIQAEIFIQIAREFHVDAVIVHANRGCPTQSLGRLDSVAEAKKRLGIPTLVIEGNSGDPKDYDRNYARKRMDEFMQLFLR